MEHTMNSENTQIELFPFLAGRHSQVARSRYLLKDLTLSVENIIVLCIVFVMAVVVFFSFGVERGKQIVKRSLSESAVSASSIEPAVVTQKVIETPVAAQPNTKTSKSILPSQPVAPKPVVEPVKANERPALEKKQKGTFTIQVASFKEKERAQQEIKRLKGKGHETFILPKGNHLIVCIGKFKIKDEAMEFSNKLKNKYNDCLVRRL